MYSGGQTYQCGKYDYVATQDGNLKRHVENMHEGVRYLCDQCDYAATKVRRHIKSNHPCDQCEYTATITGDLKRHMSSLRRHIKTKHEGIKY